MNRIKIGLFIVLFFISFTAVANNCLDSPPASNQLCNPTNQFAGDLPTFGIYIIKIFGQLIGWTVIAYMMFSGFRMVMAQGNEEEISKAKSAFLWTLSGLILSLFSFIIVYAISDFIGAADIRPGGSKNIGQLNPLDTNTFTGLFQVLFKNFLSIAGVVSLLLIIISGFRYITARGNEEQVSQARSGLLWAIIGLIVILLSYVIVVAAAKLFGADVTTN